MKSTRKNLRTIQHTKWTRAKTKKKHIEEKHERTCIKRFSKNSIYNENETKSIDKICVCVIFFFSSNRCVRGTHRMKIYNLFEVLLPSRNNITMLLQLIVLPHHFNDQISRYNGLCRWRNNQLWKKAQRKETNKQQSSIITNFAHESFR